MEEVPLLSVHDERRKKKAEEVLKNLKFHSDSLSDDYSDDSKSDCSKLSDPFSDMEEKITPQDNGKRVSRARFLVITFQQKYIVYFRE